MPSSFYKVPDPLEKQVQLREPGQQDISRFFRGTFTQTKSVFDRDQEASVSHIPPMTSKQAKLRAKQREMGLPRLSDAEMKAILEEEEDQRKRRENIEKKLLHQRQLKVRRKTESKQKAILKQQKEKGKQPEGQESLTKYGFHKIKKPLRNGGQQKEKNT